MRCLTTASPLVSQPRGWNFTSETNFQFDSSRANGSHPDVQGARARPLTHTATGPLPILLSLLIGGHALSSSSRHVFSSLKYLHARVNTILFAHATLGSVLISYILILTPCLGHCTNAMAFSRYSQQYYCPRLHVSVAPRAPVSTVQHNFPRACSMGPRHNFLSTQYRLPPQPCS